MSGIAKCGTCLVGVYAEICDADECVIVEVYEGDQKFSGMKLFDYCPLCSREIEENIDDE